MYCDGIKLIKLSRNKNNKKDSSSSYGYSSRDDSSSGSSDSSDDEAPALNSQPRQKTGPNNLLTLWENRGPVKLLTYQGDEARGILFFKNYKKLDYGGLTDFISKSCSGFLSMKDMGDNYIKVRIKSEEEVRNLYKYLKQDIKHDVTVLIDLEDYRAQKKNKKRTNKKKSFSPSVELQDFSKINLLADGIRFNERKKPFTRKPKKPEPEQECPGRFGTWNGHTVVMPDVPAQSNSTKRPDPEVSLYGIYYWDGLRKGKCHSGIGERPQPDRRSPEIDYPLTNNSCLLRNEENDFNGSVTSRNSYCSDNAYRDSTERLHRNENSMRQSKAIQKDQSSVSSLTETPRKANHHNKPKHKTYRRTPSSVRRKASPTHHSSEYRPSSAILPQHSKILEDENEGPPLISIFDLFAMHMRRSIVNNLDASFKIVSR